VKFFGHCFAPSYSPITEMLLKHIFSQVLKYFDTVLWLDQTVFVSIYLNKIKQVKVVSQKLVSQIHFYR